MDQVEFDDEPIIRNATQTIERPASGRPRPAGRPRGGILLGGGRRRGRLPLVVAGVLIIVLLAFGGGIRFAQNSTQLPAVGQPAARPGRVGPGPTRVVAGVPVGYARSRQGAVAAATNYTVVIGSPTLLDPDARQAALKAMAGPSADPASLNKLSEASDQVVKALGLPPDGLSEEARSEVAFRTIPVAWKLEQYDNSAAAVAIWTTGFIGTAKLPAQETWGVFRVQLRWVDGDWRYADSASEAGPIPAPDQRPPTPPASFVPAANEFQGYTYAPPG
jgi:hypothetical protein